LVERILRRLQVWDRFGKTFRNIPPGYRPFDYLVEQFPSLPVHLTLYRFKKEETAQWTAARLLNDPGRIEVLDAFQAGSVESDHTGRPHGMVFGMPGMASALGGVVVMTDYEPSVRLAAVSFRFRMTEDWSVAMMSLDEFCKTLLEAGWEP
jgi:hypothetical protein